MVVGWPKLQVRCSATVTTIDELSPFATGANDFYVQSGLMR